MRTYQLENPLNLSPNKVLVYHKVKKKTNQTKLKPQTTYLITKYFNHWINWKQNSRENLPTEEPNQFIIKIKVLVWKMGHKTFVPSGRSWCWHVLCPSSSAILPVIPVKRALNFFFFLTTGWKWRVHAALATVTYPKIAHRFLCFFFF